MEKRVINNALPNAVTLPLLLLSTPFQALKTERSKAETPILQIDIQISIKICSVEPPRMENIRINKEIANPMKKYFLFVMK